MRRVFNRTKNELVLERVVYAEGLLERMAGLIPYKFLGEDEGMFLTSCSSVHTFFMRFSIDCYFLNKSNKVIGIKKNVKPYSLAFGTPLFTKNVLEVASERQKPVNIDLDDVLEVK